jgi:hypothetical protein
MVSLTTSVCEAAVMVVTSVNNTVSVAAVAVEVSVNKAVSTALSTTVRVCVKVLCFLCVNYPDRLLAFADRQQLTRQMASQ